MEVKTEVAGEKNPIFMGYRISGGGMNIVFKEGYDDVSAIKRASNLKKTTLSKCFRTDGKLEKNIIFPPQKSKQLKHLVHSSFSE